MADAKVQIGDSQDFLEGTTVTTPAGADLFREGVVISDGSDPAARAKITNTSPAADAYGLAVRVVGGVVVGSEVEIKNDTGNPIPVSGSVSVSDGGGSLTVDGTVSVNNFPATQQVSGTVALDSASLAALETIQVGNFPATQAVSGTVTVTQATAANLNATVSGSVAVNNHPASQSVVGAGAAATAQRVQLADESLAALESITATVNGAIALDSATLNALESITVQNGAGANAVNIQDGGNSITVDGTVSVGNFPASQTVNGTVTVTQATAANLQATVTGTVQANNLVGGTAVSNANPLPISDAGGSLTVDGTIAVSNFPATQTVSATDLDIRNLSSAQDSVTVTGSVSVSNFPATQAVSGTVEITNDTGNPIPVSGTVSVAPSQADTNVTGTWAYAAGTAGTVTLPAGSKVLQISATSLAGGSFTVNGGAAITIPANQQYTLEPRGNLVAPTIVFTSTSSFVVEYVS